MTYKKFSKIDGSHPWREVSSEGYVDYPAYHRQKGRVLFFNFPLAQELGLIASNHQREMTPELEEMILKRFSLQIINECDEKQTAEDDPHYNQFYMATRYLQSQHKNKQGKTSGDGRSIWNGFLKTPSRTFDISSRGTGATILSPGAQEAGKPLATGDESFGYSSGLADCDEMLASAIMSEIFYRRGIPTERCLTVIDFKDKSSIGVRTAPNLIRPAHIFRYLKLGQWKELKKSMDYFMKRQEENGALPFPTKGKARYPKCLEYLTRTYAKLTAILEEEYIFNWLAWDGDNMLADGALLDYGSIRQFAAKHNKYRYEDVDRFSASLTEQKLWAKKIIQNFAQAIDFIDTKEKKSLNDFDNHESLQTFDKLFEEERQRQMLYRIGFTKDQIDEIIKKHRDIVFEFSKTLHYFEEIKTSKGEQKVPDGINHPPVFLIRHLLKELPSYILEHWNIERWPIMPVKHFCEIMAASYVQKKDLMLKPSREKKALKFQELYRDLIYSIDSNPNKILKNIAERSAVINYEYRSTGDGLTWIVQEILASKNRIDWQDLHDVLERFIQSQVLVPGKWNPIDPEELKGNSVQARHLRKIQKNLEFFKETI